MGLPDGGVRSRGLPLRPHADGTPESVRLRAVDPCSGKRARTCPSPHNLTRPCRGGQERDGKVFSKRQRRQRAAVAFLAALAVLFGALALVTQAFDTTLQTAIYDRAIAISPAQVKNQITIVAVDDLTIAKYDVYPLPRRAYADLITALKAQNPTVIAMDISFYDRSPSAEDDALLASAIKDAGNVILAMQ